MNQHSCDGRSRERKDERAEKTERGQKTDDEPMEVMRKTSEGGREEERESEREKTKEAQRHAKEERTTVEERRSERRAAGAVGYLLVIQLLTMLF